MALWMPGAVVVECLAAAEIALGKSRIAALRSAVLNICVICGILVFVQVGTLVAIPSLFALSFNALAAWGCWLLAREGALDLFGLNADRVKQAAVDFIRRLRPFISLPIFQQGNSWVERLVASGLAVGTLSSLEYARTITDTLALLITHPVGMALLHRGPGKDRHSSTTAVAGSILSITLPICVFLIAFAPDIVRIVFSRGAFDEIAVSLTSDAMRGICVGLWAATLGMILLRYLNNDGRNRAAALLLVSSFAGAMIFNLLCSLSTTTYFQHAFLLGCAESLRGIVVLSGVAYLLACHRQILRMLGISAGPVLAMIALCAVLVQYCASELGRLTLGGISCVAAMLSIAYLLMPAQIIALFARRAEVS
jgi:putative peptidoglycan lipid II flippase